MKPEDFINMVLSIPAENRPGVIKLLRAALEYLEATENAPASAATQARA